MSARLPALAALGVLCALLVAVVALTTPWDPLPGATPPAPDPARDFTADQAAREVAFHREVRPPGYAALAAGLAVAAVLGLTPLGARLVELAGRPLGGGWAARAALGVVAVLLVPAVVTLPFDLRREVVLRRYGLSTQTWGGWTADRLKAFGVSAAVSVVAVVLLYALAQRFPQTWWAGAAVAGAALTVVMSFAYPLVVEPLFNEFRPMPPGPLRERLLDLAERDGVAVSDVLVADASRRTTALNAYVSGIGATRRVVVYDTLLARATPAEVELVVAHELGHVVEHDVRDGTLLGALGVAAAMPLLWLLLGSPWLLRRAGVEDAADPRGVALLAFLVAALTFAAAPLSNLVSRRVEARADVHSLDLTRDPATFVATERRLGVTNLADLDPHPLQVALFYTHPPTPERIALARGWAVREGVAVP